MILLYRTFHLSHSLLDLECNNNADMDNAFVKLAKPSKESVFRTEDMKFLAALYQQLNVHHIIQYISPFHIYFG